VHPGAHQHTLQQIKIVFLSENLDQNMLKHALFLEKIKIKIAVAFNRCWPPATGPRPRVVALVFCYKL